MKRKTLTVQERAEQASDEWRYCVCSDDDCGFLTGHIAKAIRAAVRAALRKRQRQIKTLEIEQVNHIEIIHRNAEARIDAARVEGKALRKRRGTR